MKRRVSTELRRHNNFTRRVPGLADRNPYEFEPADEEPTDVPPSPSSSATMLCESCGYVVHGLDEAGICPECGKSIEESLPERREGSAWQGSRTMRNAWRTFWAVLRSPRAAFGIVRIDHARAGQDVRELRTKACGLTALIALTPVVITGAAMILLWTRSTGAVASLTWIVAVTVIGTPFAAGAWVVMLQVLTHIEYLGIQFFGRTRGWRVTPQVADAVCAHAAAGWVAGSIIGTVVLGVPVMAAALGMSSALGPISVLVGLAVGFGVGLVWFECLVYVGVRRCRFANADRRVVPTRAVSGETLGGKVTE